MGHGQRQRRGEFPLADRMARRSAGPTARHEGARPRLRTGIFVYLSAPRIWRAGLATDLWFSASENIQRIRDAGVEDGVFPIHADARSLPFATEFFDAIVCIDSFIYYGTDD